MKSNNYGKVTNEMKELILDMKLREFTNKAIAEELNISTSTVSYHSSEKNRKLSIERHKRNEKVRDRLEYMKNYQSKRYNNDEEFRENQKKANRENQKKKYWEKHGTK